MINKAEGKHFHNEIEFVELCPTLLSEASYLLVNYIYPLDWNKQLQKECQEVLQRLLDFENAQFILAKKSNRYVGFISINWGFSTTKGMPILRVQDIFTILEYRKRGVAKALLQKAKEIAKEHNANRIQLETDGENNNARRLYTSLGFEWLPRKEVFMLFL
jgi:ribosomal protein S18 acetylase RimI-like enzyme